MFKYNPQTNQLEKQASMARPAYQPHEFNADGEDYKVSLSEWGRYNAHLSALRKYPVQPGSIWDESKEYEIGKDFVVYRGGFSINSIAGTKVTVTDISINNGYESDSEKAHKYLKPGEVYTVAKTRVDSWFTDVWLEEFPDVRFNSVHFVSPNYYAKPIEAIPISQGYWLCPKCGEVDGRQVSYEEYHTTCGSKVQEVVPKEEDDIWQMVYGIVATDYLLNAAHGRNAEEVQKSKDMAIAELKQLYTITRKTDKA